MPPICLKSNKEPGPAFADPAYLYLPTRIRIPASKAIIAVIITGMLIPNPVIPNRIKNTPNAIIPMFMGLPF